MNKLLEAAKTALDAMDSYVNQYPHMDKGYMADARLALRQAVQEAERKQALDELTRLGQEMGLYDALPLSHKINVRSVLMDRTATVQEITDTEDFIAKVSNFTPMDLFKGTESGCINVGGYGVRIEHGIPVSVTAGFEVYDVVPRGVKK